MDYATPKSERPITPQDYTVSTVMSTRELRRLTETSPEVATTDEWRRLMRSARKARDLTQSELARKLGVRQASVSDVETGVTRQSKLVPAISAALNIGLPEAEHVDDYERRWIRAGRKLRSQSVELFIRWLDLIESQP